MEKALRETSALYALRNAQENDQKNMEEPPEKDLHYQRLKGDESHRLAPEWNVKRILASTNYRIHTDAIKENLIPPELPKYQQGFVYADEADVLNVALFGKTAKQWRAENPKRKGNMRDYATIEQLLVMTNLEAVNAVLLLHRPEYGKAETPREASAPQQFFVAVAKNRHGRTGTAELAWYAPVNRLEDYGGKWTVKSWA